MPREQFDVCNFIKVSPECWKVWKERNLRQFKRGGSVVQVFSSDAAVAHFKNSKTGRPTRVDEEKCIVRYCTRDCPDITGACASADGIDTVLDYRYAGQYVGCYIGTAKIHNFGKQAGASSWKDIDSCARGEHGTPTDAMVAFACEVWGLDPSKIKSKMKSEET